MQRVVHEYRNQSRIFNMIEGLYTYISDKEGMFDDILWLDESFAELDEILRSYLLVYKDPSIRKFNLPRVPIKRNDPKEITVCLSGGKDSAAAAYYYKQKGYKVHLYHATGINKAYGDEKTAARKIAEYLGCDLFIDHISIRGFHGFIEHPLKNYLIANGAVHFCLYNGYSPRICFGNFSKAHLDLNPFEVCAGDCIEMWQAYATIIQSVIPEFEIKIPLETNADTFKILKDDWKLFELSVSCMSPYRFRAHWKRRCEMRFSIGLFNNRCGCCWKCAIEAMWLMDTDKMEYSKPYYAHCFAILAYTIYKERGIKEQNMNIWRNYMFYPVTESKGREYIENGILKFYVNRAADVIYRGEILNAPVSTN